MRTCCSSAYWTSYNTHHLFTSTSSQLGRLFPAQCSRSGQGSDRAFLRNCRRRHMTGRELAGAQKRSPDQQQMMMSLLHPNRIHPNRTHLNQLHLNRLHHEILFASSSMLSSGCSPVTRTASMRKNGARRKMPTCKLMTLPCDLPDRWSHTSQSAMLP